MIELGGDMVGLTQSLFDVGERRVFVCKGGHWAPINAQLTVNNIFTSWQQGLRHSGCRHGLPLPPDGDDDHGVAGGDDDGGDEEERGGHEAHVEFPVPGRPEVYPALEPELRGVLGYGQVVHEDDRDRECDTEDPGRGHQPLGSSPREVESILLFLC